MKAESGWYRRWGKRVFDLGTVILTAPVWIPLTLMIGLGVRMFNGQPELFRQQRPGFQEKPFTLLKFRTMAEVRDDDGRLLPDDRRLTEFGKLLRRTSLDELPELINVIKGQMSLVGPRPLLMRYLPYFDGRERRRMDTLPGITGWAQIHGRNELPWDERLERDVWYVEHLSLPLDLRILLTTLLRVVRSEGVSVAPSTAMNDLDVEREGRGR